jgi:hypothetical protein
VLKCFLYFTVPVPEASALAHQMTLLSKSSPNAEVLAENNRLNEVPKIVTTFEELVVSARGQVKATITTAQVHSAVHNHLVKSSQMTAIFLTASSAMPLMCRH